MPTSNRLHAIFRGIVLGLSACDDGVTPTEAGADATLDAPHDDASDAGIDVVVDAYEPWCEAGPPAMLDSDGGCFHFAYAPCGLPADEIADDAGLLSRCPPLCAAFIDDRCAVLPPPYPDLFVEAGLFDAAALTEAGVFVLCECVGSSGRAPEGLEMPRVRASNVVGAHLARMAYLEAASVPAFERMHAELCGIGASDAILSGVRRAIVDEKRHAQIVARVARRFGGVASAPRVRPFRARSIEAMACENAVEGCVRETFGALVATWQAHHARDPEVRRAMTTIARDEARHAELAFRVAKIFATHLDAQASARIQKAHDLAIAKCRLDAGRAPHPDLVRLAGLPSRLTALRLFRSLRRFLRTRVESRHGALHGVAELRALDLFLV